MANSKNQITKSQISRHNYLNLEFIRLGFICNLAFDYWNLKWNYVFLLRGCKNQCQSIN